jgi:hypothetical protein
MVSNLERRMMISHLQGLTPPSPVKRECKVSSPSTSPSLHLSISPSLHPEVRLISGISYAMDHWEVRGVVIVMIPVRGLLVRDAFRGSVWFMKLGG